eukprot:scaffold1239_cov95-Skeletonema_menzelii.AAC.2
MAWMSLKLRCFWDNKQQSDLDRSEIWNRSGGGRVGRRGFWEREGMRILHQSRQYIFQAMFVQAWKAFTVVEHGIKLVNNYILSSD